MSPYKKYANVKNKAYKMKQFYYGLMYNDQVSQIPGLVKNEKKISTQSKIKNMMKIRLTK